MITLTEQDLQHIVAGSLTTHVLKSTSVFSKTYTLLAQILNQKHMTILEATQYYGQLGHALGDFVYAVLHPDTMYIHDEDT